MRRIARLGALGPVAALVVLPAAASANVYCVDVSGGDCTNVELPGAAQQALDDASSNNGPDTVRLGPMTYNAPLPTGFSYQDISDPVSVIGSGQGPGQTEIQMSTPGSAPAVFTQYFGLNVLSQGSTISDLTVDMPAPVTGGNQQYYGIRSTATNSTVTQVTVNGPGVAMPGYGVFMNSGTFSESTVSMPSSSGSFGLGQVAAASSPLLVVDDTITAEYAVYYANPGTGILTVDRSTLRPSFIGVDAVTSTVAVRNTVIDLGASAGARGLSAGYSNTNASHTSTLTADGVTIHGTGSAQVGGYAFGSDLNSTPIPGDTATLTLNNSIVDLSGGSPRSLRREANNNGIVNVTSNYSNYSAPTLDTGNLNGSTGQLTENNHTTLAPDFVDAATGNFHLLSSSPLIDIGDPAATAPGALDIDGDARAILGKDGCGPRRDIGADEFDPATPPTLLDCTLPGTVDASGPDTSIAGRRKVRTRKKKARVSFTLTSTKSASSFECSVDSRAFVPCTSPFSIKLRLGKHLLTVRSTDALGNQDATPASVPVRIRRKR